MNTMDEMLKGVYEAVNEFFKSSLTLNSVSEITVHFRKGRLVIGLTWRSFWEVKLLPWKHRSFRRVPPIQTEELVIDFFSEEGTPQLVRAEQHQTISPGKEDYMILGILFDNACYLLNLNIIVSHMKRVHLQDQSNFVLHTFLERSNDLGLYLKGPEGQLPIISSFFEENWVPHGLDFTKIDCEDLGEGAHLDHLVPRHWQNKKYLRI